MAFLDWVKRLRRTAGTADGTVRPGGTGSGKPDAKDRGDLEAALKCHHGHDLDGAEKIYRKLLQENSENVGALHLLGTLHGQKGDTGQAAKYLERAAGLSPGDPNILADLARVRVMEGRLDAAESLLRRAVSLAPGEPGHHFALARILIQRGNASHAVDPLSQAVQLNPEFVEAYSDLGAVCLDLGRYGPAKDALESAVRLDAGCVPARLNLAHLHSLFGAYDQAASQCRAVLDVDPANDQALTRLANVYALSGEDQKALRCYEQLVSLFPGRIELWNQQGCMAQKLGLQSKAAGCFERSLELDANQPETLTNLGIVYALAGKLAQSAARFESAVALRSDLASAYHNLGATYLQQGRQDEALVAYEKALNLAPQSSVTLSNVIAINNYRRLGNSRYMADLFNRYLESLAPERVIAAIPANHDRTQRRRLKIGYVSPNFNRHSVSYFIEPAIAGHDRQRFEVFCYSDVAKPDGNTERLEAAADRWRNICGESHDSVAALIRRDRIDILIDLAGHSADNRLPVFARKPAPVQISYLGYPGTTGLPEIAYRLTDAVADPPGEPTGAYTEKLLRFPRVFLCYVPPDPAPPVSASQHPRGSVCFGSFNELPKMSPEAVRTWSAILTGVPGSSLLLKARAFADEGTRARVIGWFHDAGIESARVELLARTPTLEAHLALYARVDIALDTFPYNGTTTTCEALYMGVPVVTLLGDVHASRVGASLLTATGLNSLIAGSEEAYIRMAVSLAEDLPARTRMRETLRGRLLASPLTDKRAFVDDLESIYLEAWETWCDEGAPSNMLTAPPENGPVGEIAGAIRLNTRDSYPIWLPGDPNRLITYVHCEQETWFEVEFAFLRNYLDKGMRVLDIGANCGVYTLLAARQVGPAGRVWSFEPASISYRWLSANVRHNAHANTRLLNVALSDFNGVVKLQLFLDAEHNRLGTDESREAPGELVDVRRLDRCVAEAEIANIDFVKIDAEGAEKQILDGGRRFFAEETPLVMFEIQSRDGHDWSLVEKFRAQGYSVFRLVPGLGRLVPVGEPGSLDPHALNLFACKETRLAGLSERGLLISQPPAATPVPAADEASVWRFFEEHAFSRGLVDAWRSGMDELDSGSRARLLRVLGDYVAAHDGAASPADAFARLTGAYEGCVRPDAGNIEPVLRMTGARLAAELGLRIEAARILDSLLGFGALKGPWSTRLPFLPASAHFDAIAPGSRMGDWCEASVLDAYLCMSAYSTFFKGEAEFRLLERLCETGFERPEMERRRLLLGARLGRRTRAPSDNLRRASRDNLNPVFWRQFRPEIFRRRDAG